MVKHLKLIDPIKADRKFKSIDFNKYIEIFTHQIRPTEESMINEIHNRFYSWHHTESNPEELSKLVDFVLMKAKVNAGLAAFILENGGAESEFFFPWLRSIFRSQSLAQEISYGAGYNIAGEWINEIPETDPISRFYIDDPIFRYNRERQLYVANLATTLQDHSYECPEHISKIVDFGSGRLTWTRRHDFSFDPEIQEIMAFDKDPSININEVFGPDADLEHMGLKFKHGNLEVQINNPISMDADLIILSGIRPYYRGDVFLNAVLMPAYHLLNPGGILFYDIYIDSPSYLVATKLFDWPKIHTSEDLITAIKEAEDTRMTLWNEGLKFSADYVPDSYNETPVSLMVVLQKL